MAQKIRCPFCFEKFDVIFYLEDGETQTTVHDCDICCHPIDLTATWDSEREKFKIAVTQSSGFD